MRLPKSRGPLSAWVRNAVTHPDPVDPLPPITTAPGSSLDDDDLQLALWMLYELHYRGFDGARDDSEWDHHLLRARREMEVVLERDLRQICREQVPTAEPERIVEQIEALIAQSPDSGLAEFIEEHADRAQVAEYLRLRSIYHLKESDPQTFALPRLTGRAKVALAELQYDEYGAGRPEMLHQDLFRAALRGSGLSDEYGAYIDELDAPTLASNNVMSLFALHRRLRGASMGHLAVFEATSSLPCRRISRGITRVGLPPEVSAYYDEHVEADAAHEQVALRDICGELVAAEPSLADDVLLGAQVCLLVDGHAASQLVQRWRSRRTSTLPGPTPEPRLWAVTR
ncbi:iron-containing redox enzyme family protein [Nocardioides gilvus]|uniref:iron-containing redox enzyme family protein n=1 Tax=Nocardioides gilvus TaxID=1735589 RepID=UPI000D74168F|nr:iron-containing redox enzyme family protein [Nocardioides gilvus]